MQGEEGPCTLSSPSVGPQRRACPVRRSKKQGLFHSCASCQDGSRRGALHRGHREECLSVWAVTVPGAFVMLTAATQARTCWCPPPGSLPGLHQKWEELKAVAFILIKHLD